MRNLTVKSAGALRWKLPVLAMIVMLFVAAAHTGATSVLPQPDFAPGQIWSIKSASPTTSKVVIGRIESWNGKVVVGLCCHRVLTRLTMFRWEDSEVTHG